jgi:hypothetical protein
MPAQVKTNIFTLRGKPGIKRDGTDLDNEYYQDGQWVRFQRGRPRKMGGYRSMSAALTGPIRSVYVDSRALNNTAHCFSPWGVQQLSFDILGSGGGIIDRTPAGFVRNDAFTWQSSAMFDSTGGGSTALICSATPDLASIASDVPGRVYSGDITLGAPLVAIQDGSGPIQVSGGCCVLQPFLFVYGSNGLIRNSNANDFSATTGWTGTNANAGNFAGTKIVKGLPIRGGSASPAGLFWALDSLIRVTYINGTALWKYDPVSADITVMSKSAIVEYDGIYYWPGVDRFYAYTGVVAELPNDMSSNYFFENLNFVQSQKVWALKVPRFGEIWWFYPSGANTECDSVIIFNVKENTWYDTKCRRTAGASAQVFRYPVMSGGEAQVTTLLSYNTPVGTFAINDVVTGGTSGATGTVVRTLPGQLNVNAVGVFASGETISNAGATATGVLTAAPQGQELDDLWQHEYGVDQIKGSSVRAIPSHFETNNFEWATGGPNQDLGQGPNFGVRITRFEPDFISSGNLTIQVLGKKYAQSPADESAAYLFDQTTETVEVREQRREMSLRVTSNEVGGDYQMGRPFMTLEPGDERP